MRTHFSKIVTGFTIFCLSTLLCFMVSHCSREASANGNKKTALELNKAELKRVTKLLTSVIRFKEMSMVDYDKAFLMFVAEEAVKKFRSFDKNIWLTISPQIGWSYFMSVSVHAVGGAKGERPLVAFYNPWSDVFLITVWKMDDEVPRIVDAEMLMGDWLRIEESTLSLVPYWLRTEMFKPATLGNSVAQAIMAFERLFPVEQVANWRKRLPMLESQPVLIKINYPAVALMLWMGLKNIDDFRTARRNENPQMESCRSLTIEAVRAIAQERLDGLLIIANETLPQTKTVLKNLMPEWFRTLEAVAIVTGKDGCLVFLAPVFDATGSISFFFKGAAQNLALKRIDIVDYQGFYLSLKSEKGGAPK